MDKLTALFASGIAQGMIFALVALGFLLIYKATGVINFAQGDLVTLGAYLAVFAINDLEVSTIGGYGLALVAMFVVGVAFERLVVAPVRDRSVHTQLIATFGAGLAIRALIGIWQDTTPKALRSPADGKVLELFGANIAYQRIAIVGVTLVALALVLVAFYRTMIGRQVRALASDRETALLQGVNVGAVSALTFGCGAVLAGLAGILVGPLTVVDPQLGFLSMLGAFAAAVVGGFGRLGGMVVGALLIGCAEHVVGGYVYPAFREAYPYVLMLVIVLLRPAGLFGSEVGHRV